MSFLENVSENLSLRDRVYQNLKQAIIKGDLLPDQPLVETELAKGMNISRAPIREALNKLEQEGFIVNLPRRGCKVSPISLKIIREFYEMRLLMEPYAAKTSFVDIPKEELDRLKILLLQLKEDTSNFELYLAADIELHSLLYQYIKNDYLRNSLMSLQDHSSRTRYYESYGELKHDSVITTTDEHLAILKAMEDNNPDAVERAVYTHVFNGEQRTLSHVPQEDQK